MKNSHTSNHLNYKSSDLQVEKLKITQIKEQTDYDQIP